MNRRDLLKLAALPVIASASKALALPVSAEIEPIAPTVEQNPYWEELRLINLMLAFISPVRPKYDHEIVVDGKPYVLDFAFPEMKKGICLARPDDPVCEACSRAYPSEHREQMLMQLFQKGMISRYTMKEAMEEAMVPSSFEAVFHHPSWTVLYLTPELVGYAPLNTSSERFSRAIRLITDFLNR